MKQKRIILILVLSMGMGYGWSQELTRFDLGFEVGSSFVSGKIDPSWNVRQDIGNYQYGDGTTNSIRSEMTISTVGIQPGMSFFQNVLHVSSGLQYALINSTLGNRSVYTGSTFYLSNTGNTGNTEYYRIKNITEFNHYLGIPLDVTIFPFLKQPYNLYLKVGAELNFRFLSKRHIHFKDPAMNPYEEVLLGNERATRNAIYSSVYSAVGIQFGKKRQVKYNLELILPSYILTKNNSSLVIPDFYSGFKFTVQVPVKKKALKGTR